MCREWSWDSSLRCTAPYDPTWDRLCPILSVYRNRVWTWADGKGVCTLIVVQPGNYDLWLAGCCERHQTRMYRYGTVYIANSCSVYMFVCTCVHERFCCICISALFCIQGIKNCLIHVQEPHTSSPDKYYSVCSLNNDHVIT